MSPRTETHFIMGLFNKVSEMEQDSDNDTIATFRSMRKFQNFCFRISSVEFASLREQAPKAAAPDYLIEEVSHCAWENPFRESFIAQVGR